MPHPNSLRISIRSPRFRRAFTLLEVLVAIGIIVVLVGILVPTVVTARKQAQRTRQALDLEAITTALEHFKQEHGEYPSIPFLESLTLTDSTGTQVLPAKIDVPFTGSELLGYCLLGAGPASEDTTSTTFSTGQFVTSGGNYYACIQATNTGPAATDINHWWPVTIPYWDNANGPGFHKAPGNSQTFGPYLDPSHFKTRGHQILDAWENPILYFPANPAKPNVRRPASGLIKPGYVESVATTTPRPPRQSYWDASYGVDSNVRAIDPTPTYAQAFRTSTTDANALQRFSIALGDLNADGAIDAPDEVPVQKDYLLWSAGPDGYYGYKGDVTTLPVKASDVASQKNFDDVTNFHE